MNENTTTYGCNTRAVAHREKGHGRFGTEIGILGQLRLKSRPVVTLMLTWIDEYGLLPVTISKAVGGAPAHCFRNRFSSMSIVVFWRWARKNEWIESQKFATRIYNWEITSITIPACFPLPLKSLLVELSFILARLISNPAFTATSAGTTKLAL